MTAYRNYWDGPQGVGYASLAYETYQKFPRGSPDDGAVYAIA
jgi:hypothetical protein